MRNFVTCLKTHEDYSVCLIIFDTDDKEFTISFRGKMKVMSFPRFLEGDFIDYPTIVTQLFKLYVKDTKDNVFYLNHSPCIGLLISIRETLPLSKLVFIIHDQFWTRQLRGNSDAFQNLIMNRNMVEIELKFRNLLNLFEIEKNMYETVDAIVCLTRRTYNLLLNVYKISSKDKIWLIPNGLKGINLLTISQKEKLRERYHIGINEKIILFVGRLTDLKGTKILINAFKSILKIYKYTRLVMVGPILSDSLLHLEIAILTKITYTGFLNSKELGRWYQIADIGVIPSYSEQCSYVGIEMMMYGLPIVSSDGLGLSDMFQDGVNAMVVPIGRKSQYSKSFCRDLVLAIMKLLSSEELAKEIGKNARNNYLKHYNIQQMQQKYEKLMNSFDLIT
mgnify:CR=1 FL=1